MPMRDRLQLNSPLTIAHVFGIGAARFVVE
jgi:hypothetical protein